MTTEVKVREHHGAALRRPAVLAVVTALLSMLVAGLLASPAGAKPPGDGYYPAPRSTIVKIDWTVEFNQVGTKYYGEWYGKYYKQIDWSTDACSVPSIANSVPNARAYSGFFRPSCIIHDFGYRNYGHVHKISMTRATKNLIDRRFLLNMRAQCTSIDAVHRPSCNAAAEDFYVAVQLLADSSFFG